MDNEDAHDLDQTDEGLSEDENVDTEEETSIKEDCCQLMLLKMKETLQ